MGETALAVQPSETGRHVGHGERGLSRQLPPSQTRLRRTGVIVAGASF